MQKFSSKKFKFKPSKNTDKTKKIILISSIIAVAAIIIAVAVAMILSSIKQGKEIRLISIASTPNDVNYYVGESADYTGLKVLVTQVNGDTYTVDASACTFTGFDTSKATEKQTVSVNYKNFIATFDITVEEFPTPKPKLVGISFKTYPTKLEYNAGERFSHTGGMLLREYSDGSTVELSLVPSYVQESFEAVRYTPGEHEITVTYREGSTKVTTTLPIKIN